MPIRCLTLHAPYQCRHAGACCTAHWVVRADPHVVQFVEAANLRPMHAGTDVFVYAQSTKAKAPELTIAKDDRGACLFREHRRCTLHVVGGEGALPIGCRHYPRILRRDAARTTLTLSHYCPTAASLLITNEPIAVATAGPPLALEEPLDGLDARDALPPLLRPEMLMDPESYGAWEDAAVSVFSSASDPADALQHIGAATERLRAWSPAHGALTAAVERAFASPDASGPPSDWTRDMLAVAKTLNHGAVAFDVFTDLDARWQSHVHDGADMINRVLCNYLAARTFGNWIAYQGRGLRSILAWLHATFDVVRVLTCRAADERGSQVLIHDVIEAVRHTDYVFLHTIDSQAFAREIAWVEAK